VIACLLSGCDLWASSASPVSRISLGPVGQSIEIADGVLHPASNESSSVIGSALFSDGDRAAK
jgi:hypothetical protein